MGMSQCLPCSQLKGLMSFHMRLSLDIPSFLRSVSESSGTMGCSRMPHTRSVSMVRWSTEFRWGDSSFLHNSHGFWDSKNRFAAWSVATMELMPLQKLHTSKCSFTRSESNEICVRDKLHIEYLTYYTSAKRWISNCSWT